MSKKPLLILSLFLLLSSRAFLSPTPVIAQDRCPSADDIYHLLDTADIFIRQAQYDTALSLIHSAREKITDEPDLPEFLRARLYALTGKWAFEKGNYENCEKFYDSSFILINRLLKKEDPERTGIMINLGDLYYKQARYDESEKILLEALKIMEKNPALYRQQKAACLNSLITVYTTKNDFSKADSLAFDNLNFTQSTAIGNSPERAVYLFKTAVLYQAKSEYAKAETSYIKARYMIEELYGEQHPKNAEITSGLGALYTEMGYFSKADSLLTRATAIFEQTVGDSHYLLAVNLNNRASLYFKIGMYSEMEAHSRRAMNIIRNTFGENHPETAVSLNILAALNFVQGRLSEANDLFEQALTIREKIYGPYHPEVAYLLDNLGTLNSTLGNQEKAEMYAKKALKAREQVLGPHHSHVAKSLIGVALAMARQQKYAEAVPYVERALTVRTNAYGRDHPDVAQCFDYLGVLAFRLGDIELAAENKEEAFAIYEKTLGPWHSNVSRNAQALGVIYASLGDFEQSHRYFKRFYDLRRQFCEYAFSYSSEEQKLKWIDQFPLLDNNILSLALRDNTSRSKKLALEMVLTGKAAVIDALMAEKEKALCTEDDRVKECLDKRTVICTDISNRVIAAQKGLATRQDHDSLQVLFAVKDSLEETLSRLCSDFDRELAYNRIDIGNLAQALSDSTVLWEFIRYTPTDFSSLNPVPLHTDSSRYLAFILKHTGELTIIDLGRATQIDSLIDRVREIIGGPSVNLYSPLAAEKEKQLAETTGALYGLIFAPMSVASPGAKHIFIAPDARLHLIPFEILPLPDSRYAVEKYRLSYLTSGRDLLSCDDTPDGFNNVLIIADPDFDMLEESDKSGERHLPAEESHPVYTDLLQRSSDCLGGTFSPLRYSRKEMDAIIEILRKHRVAGIQSYNGSEAREQILKNTIFVPDILHLSTHGYFCREEQDDNEHSQNALLRSGLALAGANRSILNDAEKVDTDDGILTAFEISGLNLVGTKLVVLSACETGLGETSNGEGVFGLQRAFRHAGAGTLILSLWKVPDKETGELMVKFYEYWLNGDSRIDALRRASLDMLERSRENYGHGHPALWGGFVLVGNPH